MSERVDVTILGAGIAGTMLAAILARNGLKVQVLEEGSHPRFAIGESIIPEFTLRLRLAALRFDVPELAYLTNFNDIRDKLGSSHGVKRALSFLYHREGCEQAARESLQMPTLHTPLGPEAHIFRQDIDAYYLAVAIRYGAQVVQTVKTTRIDIDNKGACVQTEKHGEFRSRYLVDASGFRSPLVKALELRENPPRYRTRSRAIFSHFVDVHPYDEIGASRKEHGLPYPLAQTTLHHVSDGGWMWIIPFNNHSRATNPLCSVGLMLDLDRFPQQQGLKPEDELRSFIQRFPSVARQFERARPVRNLAATGRLQYSSHQMVGDRWCLSAHAGAFTDALFSSGLMLSIGATTLLVDALLKACRDDDFSRERFLAVEDFIQNGFAQHDRLVWASYVAFQDFSLWNAWSRFYAMGLVLGTLGPLRCYLRYLESGDRSFLEAIEQLPYREAAGGGFPPVRQVFDRGFDEILSVRNEGKDPAVAARNLFGILKEIDFLPPSFDMRDPEQHAPTTFSVSKMRRDIRWVAHRAPAWAREALFDWSPGTYLGYTCKGLGRLIGTSLWRGLEPLQHVSAIWRRHW